ncbi:MAG: lipopolysaccharide biosynthesis protein [Chryseobacterium sp.]|uniref:lipopolysaccharide biosynthesis protein n=1 Tax=Chryseobacterium sp. TaxID=1871047 RepID=UPI003D0C988C
MKRKIISFLGSNILSQLILLIAVPLTGRIYSDYEIGVLSFTLSISAPLAYFYTLSYNKAIMLPGKSEEYSMLYAVSIFLSITISLISFFIILISTLFFDIDSYFLIVPLVAFSQSLYSASKDILIKKGLLNIVSKSMILNSIFAVIIILSGYYIKLSYWVLILSYVIPNFLATIFILFYLKIQRRNFVYREFYKIIIKYKSFPLHQMPAYFINTFNAELPSFFIKHYFGEAILGNYFMASKIVNKPLSLISESLNGLIYKDLSETNKAKLNKKMNTYVGLLFLVSLLFAIVYLIFGEYFFSLFFDINKWRKAFDMSKIIIFTTIISASFSHYSSGVLVKRKNKIFLVWEVITTLVLLVSFFLGKSSTIDLFIWIYVGVILFRYLLLSLLFNKS